MYHKQSCPHRGKQSEKLLDRVIKSEGPNPQPGTAYSPITNIPDRCNPRKEAAATQERRPKARPCPDGREVEMGYVNYLGRCATSSSYLIPGFFGLLVVGFNPLYKYVQAFPRFFLEKCLSFGTVVQFAVSGNNKPRSVLGHGGGPLPGRTRVLSR